MSKLSRLRAVSAFLGLALGGGTFVHAASVSDRVEKRFPLPPSGVVEVETADGDVSIRVIRGDEVRVALHRTARSTSHDRAVQILRQLDLRVERSPDSLRLGIPLPETKGWLAWVGRDEGGEADLEIGVPRASDLVVRARNGDVLVHSSGRSALVKTTNGDILIRGVLGERLSASTVNGDVSVKLARLPSAGRLDVSTVNGDVHVAVPDSLRAALDARTVNGCVGSNVALAESRKSRSHLVGVVNGSDGPMGQIRVRTTNGEVWVKGD